jgi:hypothetical protein
VTGHAKEGARHRPRFRRRPMSQPDG